MGLLLLVAACGLPFSFWVIRKVFAQLMPIELVPGSPLSVKASSIISIALGFALAFQCAKMTVTTTGYWFQLFGIFSPLEAQCLAISSPTGVSNCIFLQFMYRMTGSMLVTLLAMAVLGWIASCNMDFTWKGDSVCLHLTCMLSVFLASLNVSNRFFDTTIQGTQWVFMPFWLIFVSVTLLDASYTWEEVIWNDDKKSVVWKTVQWTVTVISGLLVLGSCATMLWLLNISNGMWSHKILCGVALGLACAALAIMSFCRLPKGSLISFSFLAVYATLALFWSVAGSFEAPKYSVVEWRRLRAVSGIASWGLFVLYLLVQQPASNASLPGDLPSGLHKEESTSFPPRYCFSNDPRSDSSCTVSRSVDAAVVKRTGVTGAAYDEQKIVYQPASATFLSTRDRSRVAEAGPFPSVSLSSSHPVPHPINYATWYFTATFLVLHLMSFLTDWGYCPVDIWWNINKDNNSSLQHGTLVLMSPPPVAQTLLLYCGACLPPLLLYNWSLIAPLILTDRTF